MNLKDNKMSTAPAGKLMLTMGVTMIVSMVLEAVYMDSGIGSLLISFSGSL